MSNNWSTDELEESVQVYIEMRQKQVAGESFSKISYYRYLSDKYDRTWQSFRYRMHNISYVYSLMGRSWLKGLKPAEHIGANVAVEIVALIIKIEGQAPPIDISFQVQLNNISRNKQIAQPLGNEKPTKKDHKVTLYNRDPNVVAWVLHNANGICECCESKAPFIKDNGMPFLESHHLRRLADNGSDKITNAIAVCPNCHRQLHFGNDREVLLEKVYLTISRLIKE